MAKKSATSKKKATDKPAAAKAAKTVEAVKAAKAVKATARRSSSTVTARKAAPAKAAASAEGSGNGNGKSTRSKLKCPLSAAELRQFRQMLLEKRRDIVGDMHGMQAEALRVNRQDGTGDLSSLPTHPGDIGTDNYEQEFTLGLLESERTLLTEIDEAIRRIDEKTYGVCLGTGEPIGKARLTARPWAKYGIEYARLIEKGLVNPEEEANHRASESGLEDEDDDDDLEDDEDREESEDASDDADADAAPERDDLED